MASLMPSARVSPPSPARVVQNDVSSVSNDRRLHPASAGSHLDASETLGIPHFGDRTLDEFAVRLRASQSQSPQNSLFQITGGALALH